MTDTHQIREEIADRLSEIKENACEINQLVQEIEARIKEISDSDINGSV